MQSENSSSDAMSRSAHSDPRLWPAIFGLFILPALVFSPIAGHDFIGLDDATYVSENPYLRNGLTLEAVHWAFTNSYALNWHPLTWISHLVDVELFGLSPSGHHIVGLLFHALNTVILFVALRRLTGAHWRSVFVAALFALHPLHVESVAWISERKDVLSSLLWFITIWLYARYAESPSTIRYLGVLICFVLGLLAKPMLVTLPFTLLLLDYWPLARLHFDSRSIGRRVIEKAPSSSSA